MLNIVPPSRSHRLTRISLCIVWLFMFCHVWKLVPTIYELVHAGDDASLRRWPGAYVIQSGASYLSQDFVMFFYVSCEGLPRQ